MGIPNARLPQQDKDQLYDWTGGSDDHDNVDDIDALRELDL